MTPFTGLAAQFQSAKVLVTGAAGFLGMHLCGALLKNGAEVFAVSRTNRNASRKDFHWLQADLTNSANVRQMVAQIKPDVIFHLSGMASASTDLNLVLTTYESLLTSTVCLLTSAAELGCKRFIIPGSLNEPEPGKTDPISGSPYAMAKWATSHYGRMFFKIYQTPVVIVRIFMAYGPGQASTKLIPYVVNSALRDQAPEIASGQWEADWIYIDDVIDGLLIAGCKPGIDGLTIDLGSGSLTSVRDIVKKAIASTGHNVEAAFNSREDRPFEPVRVADIAGARTALGWSAKISLTEGLDRTVRALRQELQEEDGKLARF